MPFPLLAHQAPVLPLLAWRRARFCGTALVVGSIAPDLQYLASPASRMRGFPHSLAGQLVFCLPVTLAVVLWIGRFRVGDALAARLRVRLLGGAAIGIRGARGLLTATASALVGSFSHVAFDAFTHQVVPLVVHARGGWRWRGMSFDATSIAQLIVTVLGSVVMLLVLRRLLRRADPPPPARTDGRALLAGGALVGAAAGVWRALPALREPNSYFHAAYIYVWGHLLFMIACGVAAAWLLVGALLAWRDRRRPAPPPPPAPATTTPAT